MKFAFKEVSDGQGFHGPRPVFHFAIKGTKLAAPYCLLDTGSPDTFVRRELAEESGISLDGAEEIGEFNLEGETVTGLRVNATCVITDGHEQIELPDIPLIFMSSRPEHRQFAAVLGTTGMKNIRVTICAREQWLGIISEPAVARR
jgi:hypothetical protein